MGLRVEHLDTDVIRSRIQMVLHASANRFHVTPCNERVTRLGRPDPGPYPPMTRDQMRGSLELLRSWVLAQKAAANRQVIEVMRQRLAAMNGFWPIIAAGDHSDQGPGSDGRSVVV